MFDQTELGGKYTVESDGTFSFPLIGRITAGGMTLRKFESELRTRLADGYFVDPQVSVAVEQYRSQRLYVVGEVRNPGPVPLTGGMTLIEALARAGSTLPSASGEIAIVRARQGADGPSLPPAEGDDGSIVRAAIRDLESGAMKQTIELHDGDTDLRATRRDRLRLRRSQVAGRVPDSEGHDRPPGAVAGRRRHRARGPEPRQSRPAGEGRRGPRSRSRLPTSSSPATPSSSQRRYF